MTLSSILFMNTLLRWILSVFLLVATATPAIAQPAKRIDVLALRQTCRMLGPCDVYLSSVGIKMFVKKQELVCLLLPPYKEVVCYSRPSGKIYRTPFVKFRNAFSTSMTLFSFTLEDVKLEEVGSTTKLGLPLHKFVSTKAFGKAQMAKFLKHEASGGSPIDLTFLASDKLGYDKNQGLMMERLYALPKVGLFPINVDYKSCEDGHVSYLITAKVEKTTLPLSDFSIPTNLKVAKEMQETLESGSSDEAMQLMMGK